MLTLIELMAVDMFWGLVMHKEEVVVTPIGNFILPEEKEYGACYLATRNSLSWEESTIEFIKNNANYGSVISGGVYIGTLLPGISKYCKSVYGFEPNTNNYNLSLKNISLNNLNNVFIYSLALVESSGTYRMLIKGDQKAWHGDFLSGDAPLGEKSFISSDASGECILGISIDEVVAFFDLKDISIIQLSLEGSECNAILGAQKTIFDQMPIIISRQKLTKNLPDCYEESKFTVGTDINKEDLKFNFNSYIYYVPLIHGLLK